MDRVWLTRSFPAVDEDFHDVRDHVEAQGRLLYGLVHARYILTTRGLAKMVSRRG